MVKQLKDFYFGYREAANIVHCMIQELQQAKGDFEQADFDFDLVYSLLEGIRDDDEPEFEESKYNHQFVLCFSVESDCPEGNVSQDELKEAIIDRLNNLIENDELEEAVGSGCPIDPRGPLG